MDNSLPPYRKIVARLLLFLWLYSTNIPEILHCVYFLQDAHYEVKLKNVCPPSVRMFIAVDLFFVVVVVFFSYLNILLQNELHICIYV